MRLSREMTFSLCVELLHSRLRCAPGCGLIAPLARCGLRMLTLGAARVRAHGGSCQSASSGSIILPRAATSRASTTKEGPLDQWPALVQNQPCATSLPATLQADHSTVVPSSQ